MSADGVSAYAIAKTLNAEGVKTRYKKDFKTQTVQNILARKLLTLDRVPSLNG